MIAATWDGLKGWKTYATCLLGLVLVVLEGAFGVDVPGVKVDSAAWVNDALGILAAATFRHAISTGA